MILVTNTAVVVVKALVQRIEWAAINVSIRLVQDLPFQFFGVFAHFVFLATRVRSSSVDVVSLAGKRRRLASDCRVFSPS